MEKVLEKIYKEIKTKEELNFYLEEIKKAEKLLFREDEESLKEREENVILS